MLRKISVLFTSLVILSIFIIGCDSKKSSYDEAKKAYDNGEYYKAMESFIALGDYEDSEEQSLKSASLLVAESWSGKNIYYDDTKKAVQLLYKYQKADNQRYKAYTDNLDNLLNHRSDLYYEFLNITPTIKPIPTIEAVTIPEFVAWSDDSSYTAMNVNANMNKNEIQVVWSYTNSFGKKDTYTASYAVSSFQSNSVHDLKSWPIGHQMGVYDLQVADFVYFKRTK